MSVFKDQAIFMAACGQSTEGRDDVQVRLYLRLIEEEYDELQHAVNAVAAADAVMDLIVVLIGYGLSQGWPMEKLWNEVIRSNMAKIDPDTGTVRKRADGKILKPDGWTPPDLMTVMTKHGCSLA